MTTLLLPPDAARDRFGRAVAARLSEGAHTLPHDITERLRVARQQAVARRKLVRRLGSAAVQTGAGTLALGGDHLGWWGRMASVLPLVALVVGLAFINTIESDSRVDEIAEVDAALLADDLPPTAYTDPGFTQFLKAEALSVPAGAPTSER